MSRHSFESGEQLWHVGYDRAAATYFAQVEPAREDGDDLRDVAGH